MGQFFLGESQSRIYPHMRAEFGCGPTVVSKGRGGGEYRHTTYETFTSMSGINNTANNVSNCGGDPVTQLIVNVYRMIKL